MTWDMLSGGGTQKNGPLYDWAWCAMRDQFRASLVSKNKLWVFERITGCKVHRSDPVQCHSLRNCFGPRSMYCMCIFVQEE